MRKFGFLALVFLQIMPARADRDERKPSVLQMDEQELAGAWEHELELFLEQPAVSHVWRDTYKVYDFSGMDARIVAGSTGEKGVALTGPVSNWGDVIRLKVHEIKQKLVPGLRETTFGTVLSELEKKQCPIWIIGGFVRDLLAGMEPNDLDCVAMCSSTTIQQVAEEHEWKHSIIEGSPSFSIGDAGSDADDTYLEGFEIRVAFEDAFVHEWTVNCLLWSFTMNYVIDPTGWGLQDATGLRLRPVVPPNALLQNGYKLARTFPTKPEHLPEGFWTNWSRENLHVPQRSQTDWGAWYQWSFSGIRTALGGDGIAPRYIRYIKMLSRGWKPFSPCFRFFMANNLVMQAEVEDSPFCDALGMSDFTGNKICNKSIASTPEAQHCLLGLLVEHIGKHWQKPDFVDKFLKFYIDELKHYLSSASENDCEGTGEVMVARRACRLSAEHVLAYAVGACQRIDKNAYSPALDRGCSLMDQARKGQINKTEFPNLASLSGKRADT